MWNLKYAKMNLSTKQKETHRHREQTCGCHGGGGREWDGWGVWGWYVQTIKFRMEKQWGASSQHRELFFFF